jgi:hypothetical protein
MIPLIKNDQKDLSVILASIVEATHDQVPPVEIEPVIKKLFDFFISDVLPAPQVTLGLNTLAKMVERCPYCIDEKYYLVCDGLKSYKNKSVSNAARAVCNLYKEFHDKQGIEYGFGFGDTKIYDGIEGIELLKKLEDKPKDYKMECEEILSDKQLKQLKALKIKYAAELIQHKKIKDEDVIKGVKKEKKNKENDEEEGEEGEEGNEQNDEGDEDLEELEEIEDDEEMEELDDDDDEEGEEIEDENEEDKKEDEKENENEEKKEEMLEINEEDLEEIDEDEANEEDIELDDDELEQDEESESFNQIQGFVDPESLKAYRKTRRERREEMKNEEKEKFKLNKKRKRENTSMTNREKLKFKPMGMVMAKKRLEQKKSKIE